MISAAFILASYLRKPFLRSVIVLCPFHHIQITDILMLTEGGHGYRKAHMTFEARRVYYQSNDNFWIEDEVLGSLLDLNQHTSIILNALLAEASAPAVLVVLDTVDAAGRGIGEVLELYVTSRNADILVMGACTRTLR
jgi:nucleotide-binding universal stress UspA family protein